MSFPLIKAGGWAFGEILTSAQMNALDADHANAIDGLNGGLYPLMAPIHLTTLAFRSDILEATQLTVDGNAIVGASGTGGLDVASSVNVGTDGIGVLSAPRVSGPVALDNTLTVAGILTAASLHTTGSATVDGDATLGNSNADTLTVNATSLFDSDATFTATATFNGNVDLGRFRFEIVAGALADTVLGPADMGQIIFLAGTMGTDHTYSLSGAFTAGMWFVVEHFASGGATLHVNGVDITAGQSVFWFYTGANWRKLTFV